MAIRSDGTRARASECFDDEWRGDYFTPRFADRVLAVIEETLDLVDDDAKALVAVEVDAAGRPEPISFAVDHSGARKHCYAWVGLDHVHDLRKLVNQYDLNHPAALGSPLRKLADSGGPALVLMVNADFGYAEFTVMAGLDDWLVVDLWLMQDDEGEYPQFYLCDGLDGLAELAAWVDDLTFD